MLKANISINLSKIGQNQAKISTSKKGEKWANLEINVKDIVDQYGQNITVKFSKTQGVDNEEAIWLGNGKTYYTDGVAPKAAKDLPTKDNAQPSNTTQAKIAAVNNMFNDNGQTEDLPF